MNITFHIAANWLILVVILSTSVSLLVSCYVYDFSGLYKLSWLNGLGQTHNGRILNVNAGFDETSSLLKSRFPDSEFIMADFYDAAKHTEVSIKRARKAYPPHPDVITVHTRHLPMQDGSIDKIFSILAAHEIRNDEERVDFFKELRRVLTGSGRIIITEHLRDTANFLAYNIGFFHFHSRATWLKTFRLSGLKLAGEIKITPFITTFILEKDGTAS